MECKRTQFEANIDKRRAVKVAEQNGCIADSHQVRLNLMARVRVGGLSLPEAPAAGSGFKSQQSTTDL